MLWWDDFYENIPTPEHYSFNVLQVIHHLRLLNFLKPFDESLSCSDPIDLKPLPARIFVDGLRRVGSIRHQ